jgi:hypothetical protein
MVVRMMIGGVPVQPFSMSALPPLGNPNQQLADALKQLSWAKYGRPKAEVEKAIFDRLKTDVKPQPTLGRGNPWDRLPAGQAGLPADPGAQPGAYGPPPSRPAASTTPASGNSFLDDWLAKRKGGAASAVGQTRPTTSSVGPTDALPPNINPAQPQSFNSAGAGELKIERSGEEPGTVVAPAGGGDQTVRIDKDGNISPV